MKSSEAPQVCSPADDEPHDSGIQAVPAPLPARPEPDSEAVRKTAPPKPTDAELWQELRVIFAKHAQQELPMSPQPIPKTADGLRALYSRTNAPFTQDFPADAKGNYYRIDPANPMVQSMVAETQKRGLRLHFEMAHKPEDQHLHFDSRRISVEFERDEQGIRRLTGRMI